MDPPGVGAADLQDCLKIQARRLEPPSPILIELIDKYLGTLAKNQFAQIAKELACSIDEVKIARAQLLTLNPKPGNGYASDNPISYIRPDLFVIKVENGFEIILNDYYNQPRVSINQYYCKLAKGATPEAAAYIADQVSKAEWLIQCINKRRDMLLLCANIILERQKQFFEHGPGNIAPMTLADVSASIGVHPSTVSRATQGKYLQCRWGVFPLARFFSRDISGGEKKKSADMLVNQIKIIISAEDSANPYSDQRICTMLENNGFFISRRTVAKYREQMGIPPASGRKRG